MGPSSGVVTGAPPEGGGHVGNGGRLKGVRESVPDGSVTGELLMIVY